MELLIPFLLGAVFLVYLSFGLYVLRISPGSSTNRLFALVCFCFAQWALFYAVKHSITVKEDIWFWYNWSSPGAILFTGFLVHFFILLTGREENYRPLKKFLVYAAVYLPAALFTYFGVTGRLGVADFVLANNIWVGVYRPGDILFVLYNAWYGFMLLFCFFLVFRWKKRAGKREKKQAGIILSYGAAAILLTAAAYGIPAFSGYRVALSGIFIFGIWLFGIWFAVSKYRFLGVRPEDAAGSVLNSLRDAVILTDEDGVISWANPAVSRLTVYRERELLNGSIRKILSGNGLDFEKLSKITAPEEIFVVTSAGARVPVSITVSRVKKGGRRIGYVFSLRDISPIRKAELELRKSEKRFRDIAEVSGEYIWELDADFRHTFLSERFIETSGITKEAVLGRTPFEFMVPEDAAKLKAFIQNTVGRGMRSGEMECRFKGPGGDTVWIAVRGVAVYGENGKIKGYRGTSRNITGRKKSEIKLRESEKRFRDIAVATSEYIWELDPESRFTYASERITAVLGRPMEEITGRTPFDFMPPDEASRVQEEFRKISSARRPFRDLACISVRPDGSTVWQSVSGAPVMDGEGGLAGYRGTALDVTESKRQEIELKTMNRERALLLNNIPSHIWYMKDERTYGFANRAHLDFLGLDSNSVEGKDILEIFPAEAAGEMLKTNAQVIDGKRQVMSEQLLPDRKGDFRLLGMRLTPVFDESGAVSRILCTAADITEKKVAEEKIKESIKMKENFISIVSHELRTPLTVIREGILVLLEGLAGPLNAGQKDLLSRVDRNIERLSRLISDILSFRKVEEGRLSLEFKEDDLNSVVCEAAGMLSEKAGKKGVRLSVENDRGLPRFKFDADKITQTVINLVDNSIKFTDSGEINVLVRRKSAEEAEVSVSDTGKGLPEVPVEKLFGMFEQGEDVLTGKPVGFGLGLAIAKQIISGHGGEISAANRAEKGAVFRFTLPIRK